MGASVFITVELAADLDLLVRGAGLAKGDRRLAGANKLQIIKASLTWVVPAKVEVAVAAIEHGVGSDLGTPAGEVWVHVETIRFVTLYACLPSLDDGRGGINARRHRRGCLGGLRRRSFAALAGLALRRNDLGGLFNDVGGIATGVAGISLSVFIPQIGEDLPEKLIPIRRTLGNHMQRISLTICSQDSGGLPEGAQVEPNQK